MPENREIVPAFDTTVSRHDVLVSDIRQILTNARHRAFAYINTSMTRAYWQIGKRIVQEEQQGQYRADYGTFLIKELSRRLSSDFGKGFSAANLKNFRQFYIVFPDFEKSYTACSSLSWSHLRPFQWRVN